MFVIEIDDHGEERYFLASDLRVEREAVIAVINWSEMAIPWQEITDIVPVAEHLSSTECHRGFTRQTQMQ